MRKIVYRILVSVLIILLLLLLIYASHRDKTFQQQYNNDTIVPEEVGQFTYEVGILSFISQDKFEKAVSEMHSGNIRVTAYNGGRYGIFDVQIICDGIVYNGVWDDSSGVWYDSKDKYEGSAEE